MRYSDVFMKALCCVWHGTPVYENRSVLEQPSCCSGQEDVEAASHSLKASECSGSDLLMLPGRPSVMFGMACQSAANTACLNSPDAALGMRMQRLQAS